MGWFKQSARIEDSDQILPNVEKLLETIDKTHPRSREFQTLSSQLIILAQKIRNIKQSGKKVPLELIEHLTYLEGNLGADLDKMNRLVLKEKRDMASARRNLENALNLASSIERLAA